MAMGYVAKQVRSRIMIIMEQLHETESLPTESISLALWLENINTCSMSAVYVCLKMRCADWGDRGESRADCKIKCSARVLPPGLFSPPGPPSLTYWLATRCLFGPSLPRLLTDWRTYSLTYLFTYFTYLPTYFTYLLTHLTTHSLNYSLTYVLT